MLLDQQLYRSLKMFSLQTTENLFQLNSGKKVCHGISIQPCCWSLFTLPDVQCTLIYACLPVASPKQNGLCNHLRYGGTIMWRRGLRSFHAGLARPSMHCLGDKLPTWPWMPWTMALLLSYYNQVSSYIGLKFADAAHETISIRLKVKPSKSINWPSFDHEEHWTARFNAHWKNKPADIKAGTNRNPIQVEISAILALYNDAQYS